MRICICGGGHLGHVCAGVLASHKDVNLNILSRNPFSWSKIIKVTDQFTHEYIAHVDVITNDPGKAICKADIILLCLPGYAIEATLKNIKPYLQKNQIVGSIVSSTGFFFMAHDILGPEASLFGFQRVPFIARVKEYGKSANLLGYKEEVKIATENIADKEEFRALIERLFMTPTVLLNNFYEASLTNSNPILHTGRLYSMWRDWDGKPYDKNIYFYKEWTDKASEIIIAMDNEFLALLDKLPVEKSSIPSLLEYYESSDASSLTKKIKSIPAFQSILSPMKQVEGGWVPDFSSRYFTEDFPYGLKYLRELALKTGMPIPNISEVYSWGINCMDI